ncbi:unnamed protein product [Amaranthus hypochondriacus]
MPGTFSGLTSLQFLSISLNEDLSPLPFPSEIVDSFKLVSFYGYKAKMEGMIDIFGGLPRLRNLRLSYNSFNGSLPASFDGSSIQSLWLDDAGLSGSIDVLSGMTHLTQVWLHGNKFTGPIPDLSNCTEIFDLQLRDNQFTGIVPSSIVSLPKLQNATLQNNKLQGSLPKFPDNVLVNVLLEVSGALGYPIKLADSWKGNDACNQWSFVYCDSNKKVIVVNFAKQGFSGTISPAFANLTSLINLFLNDNNLIGTIPDSLVTLSKLRTINVTNNDLSGILPKFRPEVNFLTEGNKNIRKVLPPPASCPDGSNSSGSESKLGGGSNGSSVLRD